jgi:hypothetical protein
MLVRSQGKWNPIHYWWECKLVQPLWKSVWRIFKNLKIGLAYDPAILFISIYPKECKSADNRDTCTLMFNHSTIHNSQIMDSVRCPPINEWIKKILYIYTHNGVLFSHKEELNYIVRRKVDVIRDCVKWNNSDE